MIERRLSPRLLVRHGIFAVAPVNPLLMSGEEREKAAGTFQLSVNEPLVDGIWPDAVTSFACANARANDGSVRWMANAR